MVSFYQPFILKYVFFDSLTSQFGRVDFFFLLPVLLVRFDVEFSRENYFSMQACCKWPEELQFENWLKCVHFCVM